MLTPVGSISYIDHDAGDALKEIVIGSGDSGPHFTKMLTELLSLQCGDVPDEFGSTWKVEPAA